VLRVASYLGIATRVPTFKESTRRWFCWCFYFLKKKRHRDDDVSDESREISSEGSERSSLLRVVLSIVVVDAGEVDSHFTILLELVSNRPG
jgi:hypothetical protein